MTRLSTFLLVTAAAATAAAAPKIVGGPLAVNVGPRSATVVWIVESDALTLVPAGGPQRHSPSLRVEKTTLSGLQPNTRYDYNVPGYENVKGSFKTPPTGREPYRFIVYGDTRTRHDMHRRVIGAMLQYAPAPDLLLNTGDLVADGNDSSLWPLFFDIERDLLRGAAFFPALGNHERNCRDFYDFFQVTTPYYSFDWGKSHFIVLNSDIGNAASSERAREVYWTEQTRWLEEDLQKSQSADFRFVMAHHPPFSAVSGRQNGNPQMAALVPLFEKYRVTAAFFGHDHNYQRYLKNGVQYIITGGGGAPLYDVSKPDPAIAQKVISVENFVTVSVEGKVVRVHAIGVNGETLDEIEVHTP